MLSAVAVGGGTQKAASRIDKLLEFELLGGQKFRKFLGRHMLMPR